MLKSLFARRAAEETNNTVVAKSNEKKLLIEINVAEDSAEESNPLKGKWVSIFSDSESSFGGWSYNSKGLRDYFGPSNKSGTKLYNNDVYRVEQMWWYPVLTKLGAKLCVLNAIGATNLCDQGKDNDAVKRIIRKEISRKVW
jgi:hypothetical protein